ncbi:hypothetical protein PFISCL1PPCAC_16016 [Pristionchus fissidentatus]|uniref:Pur-alpha n=1 Tax=Pristionchus fissidentatus TaxID=1538716 RepID=A0AAV5W1Y0_9BILA|nr:hypothetical protein PFISCL1PPCAC_16016 [Pristionchus fissidentatus]
MSDSEHRNKKGGNEDEIASKLISVAYKRFYVDVKQNTRGRFIKIAEMGANHKSRVVLSMSAASALVDKLEGYLSFHDTTPEDPKREETTDLMSDILNFETRRYYLDLKENSRGRFLRLAQTSSLPRPSRSQVAIPMVGLKEIKECIADFISKFGEGYMDSNSDLMDAMTLKSELGKTFYFDANQNDRGSFLRVSEVKSASGFRTSITIPASSLTAFRKVLTEAIEKLNIDKTDVEA